MNRSLVVALLVLGAVCIASAADVEETDGLEEVHDADTPTRQAQRAMLAEREAATAKHAASNEDVLGMRLQAVSTSAEAEAEASRPQPHARRISGASKSFSPNDKMCVMCKFLTERIQQDLSLGFGHAGHIAFGGAGMPPYAMISAVPAPAKGGDSFMEVESADSDEEADLVEIDSEDESEAEAEAEEEEEETDSSLIQIEASEDEESEESEEEEESDESEESEDAALLETGSEDETEWTTPEYSAAEAPATAMLETSGSDFQTPAYIDAVYQTSEDSTADEAEDESEAEAEDASEGTADSAEPAFFESSAVAGTEAAAEWTTPEYVGAPATEPLASSESVEAELTSFVETASEDEWTTPEFSDSMKAASGAKAYARVIVPAEHEISLIEAASTETVASSAAMESETGTKLFTPQIVSSKRTSAARPVIFHTQKRYRAADAVVPRPRWARMDHHHMHHMSSRLLAGMALRSAEHSAYDKMEAYCSTRLPESYGKYCRPVLRLFRRITDALSYGDSPARVCLAVDLCKPTSYLAQSPHDHLAARN